MLHIAPVPSASAVVKSACTWTDSLTLPTGGTGTPPSRPTDRGAQLQTDRPLTCNLTRLNDAGLAPDDVLVFLMSTGEGMAISL